MVLVWIAVRHFLSVAVQSDHIPNLYSVAVPFLQILVT